MEKTKAEIELAEEIQFFQESFLLERLSGIRELTEEKTQARMEYLGIHITGPQYIAVIFAPYLMEKKATQIDVLLSKMIKLIRNELNEMKLENYCVVDSYCNVISVVSIKNKDDYRRLCDSTEIAAESINKTLKIDLFASIGIIVSQFSEIYKSREAAKEGLSYKFTFAHGQVVNARDVERIYNQSTIKYGEYLNRILGSFYDGNMQLLRSRFNELRIMVDSNMQDPLTSLKNLCIEMTASIIQRTREIGMNDFSAGVGVYTNILGMKSLDEITDWFIAFCEQATRGIKDIYSDKNNQITVSAYAYIKENLHDQDLTLQKVSDYVSLSPNYFSDIFYQKTGTHFNEYVNQLRVEEAKELLKTTNMKATGLASYLGFSSATYFNNVFKKYVGIPPQRYRREN